MQLILQSPKLPVPHPILKEPTKLESNSSTHFQITFRWLYGERLFLPPPPAPSIRF
jgi:hypothetical protein